jgi:hypothetical protein
MAETTTSSEDASTALAANVRNRLQESGVLLSLQVRTGGKGEREKEREGDHCNVFCVMCLR